MYNKLKIFNNTYILDKVREWKSFLPSHPHIYRNHPLQWYKKHLSKMLDQLSHQFINWALGEKTGMLLWALNDKGNSFSALG